MERYFTILHYMRYLGRLMTQFRHTFICQQVWYVHSLADEKIVVMVRRVRMKKLWFQEAEMITRKFLRPSKKSFLIWFLVYCSAEKYLMLEVSWNSVIKAFDIGNNIFSHWIFSHHTSHHKNLRLDGLVRCYWRLL